MEKSDRRVMSRRRGFTVNDGDTAKQEQLTRRAITPASRRFSRRHLTSAALGIGVTFQIYRFTTVSSVNTRLLQRQTSPQPQAIAYKHNNSNLAGIPKCTEEQRKDIDRQLQLSKAQTRLQLGFFQCPNPTWLEGFLRQQQIDGNSGLQEPFLGISIGCNKGQDAIKLARIGTGSAEYDVDLWVDSVVPSIGPSQMKFGGGFACPRVKNEDSDISGTHRVGEVHCVEPLPINFALLQNASAKLDLSEKNGWHLTQAAVSSVDGTIKFPEAEAGTESIGMHDCLSNPTSVKCLDVQMYSLESYVSKYVKSLGPIDVLQIDVEGWDFDVLFGAGSVLDRSKYVEFEYHQVGHWKDLSLPTAVELLDVKGFTCYWAGKAQLWRITGCNFDYYQHWHGWSNVACVHRSNSLLAQRMEDMFIATLKSW